MDARVDGQESSRFLSSDRLASLSDTMFGVAMTLLATSLLPAAESLKGSALEMLATISGGLGAVVLSFAISAAYWVSQQRRLAMTASVTPWQTVLHLVFLLLIVLVPLTTGLPGAGGSNPSKATVLIYGAHLALIALVNLLLWIEVHRLVAAHGEIARSGLSLAVFIVALVVGSMRPAFAQYLWFSVFPMALLGRSLTRRIYGA